MMKKTYLLFCILLIGGAYNTFSQSKDNKKESYITFDVYSPVLSYSPKWRLGYYREINDRFILGATMGIGNYDVSFNFLKETDWIEKDYFIIEFSPELFYILTPNYRVKHFISSELFYIYHTDNLKNDF